MYLLRAWHHLTSSLMGTVRQVTSSFQGAPVSYSANLACPLSDVELKLMHAELRGEHEVVWAHCRRQLGDRYCFLTVQLWVRNWERTRLVYQEWSEAYFKRLNNRVLGVQRKVELLEDKLDEKWSQYHKYLTKP